MFVVMVIILYNILSFSILYGPQHSYTVSDMIALLQPTSKFSLVYL